MNDGGGTMPARPLSGSTAAIEAEIRRVIDDPVASYWLRDALEVAVARDPVDAADDAGRLQELLELRLNATLLATGRPPSGT